MKKLTQTLALFLLFVAIGSSNADDTVVVIVNSENTQAITEQDVKNIYYDRLISWENGQLISVYNLPVESKAREAFAQNVLAMSSREQASAENNRKITNTINNPTKTKRERLVATAVSRDKYAIGYVSKKTLKKTHRVRVLFELE